MKKKIFAFEDIHVTDNDSATKFLVGGKRKKKIKLKIKSYNSAALYLDVNSVAHASLLVRQYNEEYCHFINATLICGNEIVAELNKVGEVFVVADIVIVMIFDPKTDSNLLQTEIKEREAKKLEKETIHQIKCRVDEQKHELIASHVVEPLQKSLTALAVLTTQYRIKNLDEQVHKLDRWNKNKLSAFWPEIEVYFNNDDQKILDRIVIRTLLIPLDDKNEHVRYVVECGTSYSYNNIFSNEFDVQAHFILALQPIMQVIHALISQISFDLPKSPKSLSRY